MNLGLIVLLLLLFTATSSELIGQEESVNEVARMKPFFCYLPSETGPCKAGFRRYYYDHKKDKCLKFTYGGCRGNRNNFKTMEECNERCGSVPKKCGSSPYSPVWPTTFCFEEWDGTYIFDEKVSQCIKTYPCCQYPVEVIKYDSKEMCERQCQPEIKPKPEKCGNAGQMCYLMFCDEKWDGTYMFDKQTSQCERTSPCCHFSNKEYVYESKEMCERQCQAEIKPKPKKCGNAGQYCLYMMRCNEKWDGTYILF